MVQREVLNYMADRCDDKGFYSASLRHMATELARSPSSIGKAVTRLEEDGYLSIERRGRGRMISRYRLLNAAASPIRSERAEERPTVFRISGMIPSGTLYMDAPRGLWLTPSEWMHYSTSLIRSTARRHWQKLASLPHPAAECRQGYHGERAQQEWRTLPLTAEQWEENAVKWKGREAAERASLEGTRARNREQSSRHTAWWKAHHQSTAWSPEDFPLLAEGQYREEAPPNGVHGACRIWTGELNKSGYPIADGTLMHRLAYQWLTNPDNGGRADLPILTPGMEVDHRCNVPACINPAHLQALTRGEHQRVTRERQSFMLSVPEGQTAANAA